MSGDYSQEDERANKLRAMTPLSTLPKVFQPHGGGEIPDGLIGANIVRFGAVPESSLVEGGGLIIDYIPKRSEKIKRAVFEFTELGMWVIFEE